MVSGDAQLASRGGMREHGCEVSRRGMAGPPAFAASPEPEPEARQPEGLAANAPVCPAAGNLPASGNGTVPESASAGTGMRLSDAMACVSLFHQAFDLPRSACPSTNVPAELARLRVDLLVEETGEFADATASGDLVEIADALADIVYVAYGAAVTYGIDLDAALREVHRSNMSKLDEDGRPVYREDGKVLKSARYTPPDIAGVLSSQPPLPF